MSQMYMVHYQTNFEDKVDQGSVVICATSIADAENSTLHHLGLPGSRTKLTVTRIKPPIYTVDERVLNKPRMDRTPRPHHQQQPPQDLRKYQITATATVSCADENVGLQKFGRILQDRGRGEIRDKTRIMVDCKEVVDSQRKLTRMEQVETYKPKTFIGGQKI